MKRLVIVCTCVLVAGLVGFTACKQGEGERCQVDADCDDGLSCNEATNTCQSGGAMGMFDAMTPIVIDAAIDAPPDTP